MRRLVLALVLTACDSPPANTEPAPTPAKPPEPAPPAPAVDVKADAAKQAERDALHAQLAAQLAESRALHEARKAGTLGDRLADGDKLLIDGEVDAAEQVQYVLLDGLVAPMPTRLSEATAKAARGRTILLGGEDATRDALFRGVPAGEYTACVAASPPMPAARKAQLEAATAAYKAEHGDKLDAAALMAAAEKMKADPTYVEAPIEWDNQRLRCASVIVTAQPSSRLVTIFPYRAPRPR